MEANRLEILKKIESGELSVDEGFRQLNQVEGDQAAEAQAAAAEVEEPAGEQPSETADAWEPLVGEIDQIAMPEFSRYRVWTWVMFGFFVFLTGISAWWMVSAWQRHPFGWGFWLSWIPFIIGILGMATSFNARWLHLRVREKKNGEWTRINLSFPLPLGLGVWVLSLHPQWLPQEMRDKNLGASLDDLNKSITRDQPFYLKVDEDDEQVEIFIG